MTQLETYRHQALSGLRFCIASDIGSSRALLTVARIKFITGNSPSLPPSLPPSGLLACLLARSPFWMELSATATTTLVVEGRIGDCDECRTSCVFALLLRLLQLLLLLLALVLVLVFWLPRMLWANAPHRCILAPPCSCRYRRCLLAGCA